MLRKEERKAAGEGGEGPAEPAFDRPAGRSNCPRSFPPFIATGPLVLSFVFLVVLAIPASAQSPTPLARSVEITITNVDVVVTDKKGKPVTDLTRDDFEVREDGVRQALTHFSLQDLGSPDSAPAAGGAPGTPASAAPHAPNAHLVFFIDDIHLSAAHRNAALQGISTFLTKAVGPRVDAQVITWDHAMRIRGPFTNDASLLAALLRSLKKESALGDRGARERDMIYRQIDVAVQPPPIVPGRGESQDTRPFLIPEALSTIDGWSEVQAHEVQATLHAARAAIAALAGVEGRKILFLVTEQLVPVPGQALRDYMRARVFQADAARFAPPADLSEMKGLRVDQTPAFQELARTANAASVSLVTVDAAGLSFDSMLSSERGGFALSPNEGLSALDAESALLFLANETGGAALLGKNDLAKALAALEPGWRTYYSIGFESGSARPGASRKLSVSVRRPGVVVRSRRTLVERTHEQKIADAVLSGVYFPRTSNPLGASLHVGTPEKSGKLYLVPLEFRIPYENLALIPRNGRAQGRILLTIAARTFDGRISDVMTQHAPVEIAESDLDATAGKSFLYATTVKLKPGEQVVSLALTDEVSQLTSFVQPGMRIGSDVTGKPRAQ